MHRGLAQVPIEHMSYFCAVPAWDGELTSTTVPLGPNVITFESTLKDQSAVAEAKTSDVAVIGPGGEQMKIAITSADLRACEPKEHRWKDSMKH